MSDSAWPDGSKWSGGTSGANSGQYGDPGDSSDVTRIQSFSLPIRPQSQPQPDSHEEQHDPIPGQQAVPVSPGNQEYFTSTYRIPSTGQDYGAPAQPGPPAGPEYGTSPHLAAPASQDFATTVQPSVPGLQRGPSAPMDYQQPPSGPAFQPSSQDFATTVQPAVPGLQRDPSVPQGPMDYQQAPSALDYQRQPPPPGYQQPPSSPGYPQQQAPGYRAYPAGPQPYPASQPDAYGSGATRPQSAMATAALVCSVLWGAGITALAGVILGYLALNQIKQRGEEGRDRALAGLVIGVIGLVIALAIFIPKL